MAPHTSMHLSQTMPSAQKTGFQETPTWVPAPTSTPATWAQGPQSPPGQQGGETPWRLGPLTEVSLDANAQRKPLSSVGSSPLGPSKAQSLEAHGARAGGTLGSKNCQHSAAHFLPPRAGPSLDGPAALLQHGQTQLCPTTPSWSHKP